MPRKAFPVTLNCVSWFEITPCGIGEFTSCDIQRAFSFSRELSPQTFEKTNSTLNTSFFNPLFLCLLSVSLFSSLRLYLVLSVYYDEFFVQCYLRCLRVWPPGVLLTHSHCDGPCSSLLIVWCVLIHLSVSSFSGFLSSSPIIAYPLTDGDFNSPFGLKTLPLSPKNNDYSL